MNVLNTSWSNSSVTVIIIHTKNRDIFFLILCTPGASPINIFVNDKE